MKRFEHAAALIKNWIFIMWAIHVLSRNTTYRLLSLPRIIRSSYVDSFQMGIMKKALNHLKISHFTM